MRERLNPGGVVIVNAGHPEGSRELEKVLAAGVRSAFPHVRAWDITVISTLLVAGDRVPDGARVAAADPPTSFRSCSTPTPPRSARRSSATRSTPTTARRWSG